jgi:hypothetical protein
MKQAVFDLCLIGTNFLEEEKKEFSIQLGK